MPTDDIAGNVAVMPVVLVNSTIQSDDKTVYVVPDWVLTLIFCPAVICNLLLMDRLPLAVAIDAVVIPFEPKFSGLETVIEEPAVVNVVVLSVPMPVISLLPKVILFPTAIDEPVAFSVARDKVPIPVILLEPNVILFPTAIDEPVAFKVAKETVVEVRPDGENVPTSVPFARIWSVSLGDEPLIYSPVL